MIEFENTEVIGWEHAIHGMRNPMNSWEKSDSIYGTYWGDINGHKCFDSDGFNIGTNDHDLMKRLCNAGTDHRKFMRMIVVYVDITAPLYWWKEFDTYKVGTVANSCSTMHKIHEKEFTMDDFSCEHLLNDWNMDEDIVKFYNHSGTAKKVLDYIITALNHFRNKYLEISKQLENDMERDEMLRLQKLKKNYWWQMIQLLPTSYNQKRTIMLNYEVLANIYKSRKNHKLDEWKELCEWIESLPYSELIIDNE